jgi:hypothetical protein
VAKEQSAEGIQTGSGLMVADGPRGRGVFATRRFEEGEVVETCATVEVPDDDVSGRLNDYVFSATTGSDVVLVLGHGMLYNHSHDANLEYVEDEENAIAFRTTRTVRPGEELTIDYGEEWWETRGLEPL